VLLALQEGTPPMMGQQRRTESLFYYFRLEEQIPSDHLLRMIDGHVDFSFVREQLKEFYSSTGRPSIDPEILLRLLLVGYPYGITSERRLLDEVRMHLAYRWFTSLGFDQEIPDHSTFSKNRHGRFRQSGVSEGICGDRASLFRSRFGRGTESGGGWDACGRQC
jgi:transposase